MAWLWYSTACPFHALRQAGVNTMFSLIVSMKYCYYTFTNLRNLDIKVTVVQEIQTVDLSFLKQPLFHYATTAVVYNNRKNISLADTFRCQDVIQNPFSLFRTNIQTDKSSYNSCAQYVM